MGHSPIVAPVVALVLWTLVVQIWMYAARLPAMRRAGISLKGRRGGRPGALDGVVEDQAQWKAHNYNHLMEQPTLFYATALTLGLIGAGAGLSLYLAWAYVGLRVLHSLVQATANIILYRFLLFNLASLVLLALAVRAALAVCSHI